MAGMPPRVTICGEVGCLFEGDAAGSLCFVPETCVQPSPGGRVVIDEARYFRSRWAHRNLRCADDAAGVVLFPRADRPITDLHLARVERFLQRVAERTTPPFSAGSRPAA